MTLTPRLAGATHGQRDRYNAAQYTPNPGECWYHVLYGHVPRHQMDTILRPVIPTQRLHPQHFAQLQPYIKLVMPPLEEPFAFALCNLSCEDTQHQPGRGGLALVVSTRVSGLRDHALRDSLVFAHAAVAIDERFSPELLTEAAIELQHLVLEDGVPWYRSYYTGGHADSLDRAHSYLRHLHTLPRPEPADVGFTWCVESPPPHNLLLIECGDAPFADVARCMARIGSVLYRTNLRWASISTGMEEIPRRVFDNEEYALSVRLLRGRRQATQELPAVDGSTRLRQKTLVLSEIGEALGDERYVAELFGLPPAPRPLRPGVSSPSAPPPGSRANGLSAGLRDVSDEPTRLIDSRVTMVSVREPAPAPPPPLPSSREPAAPADLVAPEEFVLGPPAASRGRRWGSLSLSVAGVLGASVGALAVSLLSPRVQGPAPASQHAAPALPSPSPSQPPGAIPSAGSGVTVNESEPGRPIKPSSPSGPVQVAAPQADRSGQIITLLDRSFEKLGHQLPADPEHKFAGKIGKGAPGSKAAKDWSNDVVSAQRSRLNVQRALAEMRQGAMTEQALRERVLIPYCRLNDSATELTKRMHLIERSVLGDEVDRSRAPAKKSMAQDRGRGAPHS